MLVKKEPLINDEIYHVIMRGVGDSLIFKDINDYYRGIFSIYEFNNTASVSIFKRRLRRITEKKKQGQTLSEISSEIFDQRDLFVEILVFCFMPNHIHLLVKQLKSDGISQFMQKVGTGYAVYFNKKYNRKGHLFNKFKSVHIATDDQLKNVFTYIHANPVSLIEPGWKEKDIENLEKVIEFLNNYKWSSYQDYIGVKNFPSITSRDFLFEVIGGESGCRELVESWVKYKKEINSFKNITLEDTFLV